MNMVTNLIVFCIALNYLFFSAVTSFSDIPIRDTGEAAF